ncbi:MAG: nitroreductase [Clostridia bacterium]|nr:nitroreductase [Clostridia bacterium]
MSTVQENILSRRSVKAYKPDAVPKELIDRVIEAGLYAANGRNWQSSIVLAVTDKTMRDRLSAMNAAIMGKTDFDPFYGAPVVLVVLGDKQFPTHVYDGSLMLGNMMLAAHDLGLGSCWIHRAKEEFESEEGKEILHSLGIEGDYEGIGHLILGYAATEPKAAPPRRPGRVYEI